MGAPSRQVDQEPVPDIMALSTLIKLIKLIIETILRMKVVHGWGLEAGDHPMVRVTPMARRDSPNQPAVVMDGHMMLT